MEKVKIIIPFCILLLAALACNFPSLSPSQATDLPSVTPSPEGTPTPTNTPQPTATPTPEPEVKVELGDQAIFNGDWESASEEYQSALEGSSDQIVNFAARLGLARTHFRAGELDEAQDILEGLTAGGGEDRLLSEAYFLLAQVLETQGDISAAVEAYEQYLKFGPGLIDRYVHELRGDLLSAAGDYPGAIAAYQVALGEPGLDSGVDIEFKMALAYDLSGDLATAVVAYQDIYSRTANEDLRARLDYLLGNAFSSLGETGRAQEAYLDAVQNYPLSYNAYLSLVELVDSDVEVNELQRGLTDYFAGQYSVAIAAFDRYLRSDPADAATALYYKGLSQSVLGDLQGAMETWDEIIQSHPDSDIWDNAWEESAELLWFHSGEYREATQLLIEFVDNVPTHPRAAEFLFQAARIAERGDHLDLAARTWERVAKEYPESEDATQALFLAGITRYRMADYLAAFDRFKSMLAQTSDPEERSAAYFWMGKSNSAFEERETTRTMWEQASAIDPTGYYSQRANDLLKGELPFTPPLEYDLSFDLESEKREAEQWILTIFGLAPETDLSSPGPLAGDARYQRGNEFWRLGLFEVARAEFEDLRNAVETDPANSYRLANHLLELGLYRSAIFAMRQVLDQAGMDDAETFSAPIYFNHIRFGVYYRDMIMDASQVYNFHPLFLVSVIRQESLFEGFVRSVAGARGLMQIMPSTGQEIAANSEWLTDYRDEDLYRPAVSIILGSEYLNRQRGFMSGDLYGTLAAYNAGPGNAITWQHLVPPDPDLFLEVIRFEETRNYIKGVYEIFSIYKELYDRTP